jgi:hypothetical protein
MEPGPNELVELWLQGMKDAASAKEAAALASGERRKELEALAAAALNKAESARERLFTEHFVPVVRARVGVRFLQSSDAYRDTCQEVFGFLTKKLQQLSARLDQNGTCSAIRTANWRNYAGKVAFHCVVNHIRRQSQAWRSISGRLHYLFESHHEHFAIWRRDGREVCGRRSWRDKPPVHLRSDDPRLADVIAGLTKPWPELVDQIFEVTGGPVRLDHLVALLHRYSVSPHETQQPAAHEDDNASRDWENLPAQAEATEYQVYLREVTERMWKGIWNMPVEHRRALMLNLKGADGGDIQLVDYLQLASREEIARCVEVPSDQFERLWPNLPLDDNRIAELFGGTRQQVINWRSAARDRLRREMNGWHEAI